MMATCCRTLANRTWTYTAEAYLSRLDHSAVAAAGLCHAKYV